MADKTRNYGEITAIQIVTDDSNELAGVLYHDMREKECYVFAKRDANGGFSLKEFTLTEDEVGFPELHMIAGQPVVVCTTYLDLITSYNAWDKPESNRSARPKVHHYAHKILSPLHLPNGKVISGDGDVSCFLPAHGKTSSYLVITDSVNYNSPFFDVIDLESGEKTRTITARCALPSCQTETGPIQMFLEDGYWVNYNIETGENLGRVDSVNDAFHRMRKQNEVGLPRISCDLVDFLGDPQSPTHALMRYEGTDYVPAADRYDVSYGIPGGGDDFHYLLYDLTKGADEPPKRYIMAHTGSLWEGAPIPDYNETYDQKLPTGHDQIRILKPRLTYFGDEVVVTGMADSVVEMPPVRYRQQRIEPKRKPGYIAWIPDSNSEVQPELGWSDMPPRDYRS